MKIDQMQEPEGRRRQSMGTVETPVLDLAIRHHNYSQTLEASLELLSNGKVLDELAVFDIEEALDGIDGLKFHSQEALAWLA
jgi:hypothetical protein